MKKLKLLVSFTFVTLAFASPQMVQSTEDFSKLGEQKKPSGMQLSKGADDTLEAVLGTGNNVMLKLSMGLKTLKTHFDKKQVEVPMRLFLTDFTSSPTTHPAVDFKIKVDCELTAPICILPDKPQCFSNYAHFTNWLNQGYFTNQVNITYDFYIDVQQSAPFLVQHLFSILPGGYQFIGTHAIENKLIKPDQCTPQITYTSKRDTVNATTMVLQGTFYLNDHPYPIDDHQQIFPHRMIEEIVFKKDEAKKFCHYQWLAQSEITAKVTYEEFPNKLIMNWPNVPSGTYSVAQQKPGDKEEIEYISCLDSNGEEIDLKKDGKIFLIVCEAKDEKIDVINEAIVKEGQDKLYIIKYRNLKLVQQIHKNLHIDSLFGTYQMHKNSLEGIKERVQQLREKGIAQQGCSSHGERPQVSNYGYSCADCSLITSHNQSILNKSGYGDSPPEYREDISKARQALQVALEKYKSATGEIHPRWEEFTKM